MNSKILILIIFSVVVIGGILFFGGIFDFNKQTKPEISVNELGGFFDIEPVVWADPENPMQSGNIEQSEIPKGAIKIEVSAQGFSPSSFEVKAGEVVVLVLTSADQWSHSLRFEDERLSKIALSVGSGKTGAITFYAPEKIGEYPFFCSLLRHKQRGETGTMIVE